MSGATVQKLKDLRLLPPPFNELVPVLCTILLFGLLHLTFGQQGLEQHWKTFVDSTSWSAESLFVYGNWAVYMTVYWGYSLAGHMAEHLFPILREFKIQQSQPITSWSEVLKMTPLVLFNQIFLAIPMLKVYYQIMLWRSGSEESLLQDVPSMGRFVLMMPVHVLSVEIWFYMIHRLLHTNRFLYQHVHSIHHSYVAPSWVESVYVHPVEYVLNSCAVLLVAPIVTGAPMIVGWMWMWTTTFLQVHDHAGYCIPFTPRVLMHDFHHQKPNCCFGIIGLMDGVLGTAGTLDDFAKDYLEGVDNKKGKSK